MSALPAFDPARRPPVPILLRFFLLSIAAGVLLPYLALSIDLAAMRATWKHPHVLGLAHLATLGWLTAVMIGASYALIPVISGNAVALPKRAGVVLAHLAAGVPLMVLGFFAWLPPVLALGTVIVAGGIAGYCWRVWPAVFARPADGPAAAKPHARYLRYASVYLPLTVVAGALLVVNLITPLFADVLRWLTLHLTLGVAGWGAMMLTGVGYELIPMFSLSHGCRPRFIRSNVWLLNAVIAAAALRAVWPGPLAALDVWLRPLLIACVALFITGYAWDVLGMLRRRLRRLDASLTGVALSPLWLAAAGTLWAATLLDRTGTPEPWPAIAWLLGFGWFGSMIWSLLGKILPFLCWYDAFGSRLGREEVPAAAALLPQRWFALGQVWYHVGILPAAYGLWQGVEAAFSIGAGLTLFGSAVFALCLHRAYRNSYGREESAAAAPN